MMLFMFLFIFIVAAGAFFLLNIVENYENHIIYVIFMFIVAAGAFFQLNIVEHVNKSYYLRFI